MVGYVETPEPWDSTGDAEVWISNAPEIPTVKINNIQIPPIPPNPPYIESRYQDWNFPISAGDTANLLVSYTKLDGNPGTATASITVSGQFEITSPDPSQPVTIPKGQGLTVEWTSSNGADAYEVYFYLEYEYIDTTGYWKGFYYRVDTFITNTSITFDSSELFPNLGEIDTIDYSWGYFDVYALTGPWKEGDDGNVRGDGMGFFYGWTFGGYLDIRVENTTYLVKKERKTKDHFKEFLEKKAKELFPIKE